MDLNPSLPAIALASAGHPPFSKGGEIFPPFLKGRCEKIRFPDEISFSRCPGDGKIRAAKIGGTGMTSNGLPSFREGTPAT